VVLVNQHEPVSGTTAAQWRHQKLDAAKLFEEMKRMGVRPFG
jgi:hypothetical protein